MLANCLALLASGVSVASAARSVYGRPNLFWNDTLSVLNPATSSANISLLKTPPHPFAAEDPTSAVARGYGMATNQMGYLAFYGTSIKINGEGLNDAAMVIDTVVQPRSHYVDGRNWQDGNNSLESDPLTFKQHRMDVRFGDSNSSEIYNYTIVRGMETDAPTLDDVRKTIVPFVQDGKPNTESPYIEFDWSRYKTTVLTQTPSVGGQISVPYDALQIMDWQASVTTGFHPMTILPPANTSFLVINATVGPNGSFFMLNSTPPLSLQDGSDLVVNEYPVSSFQEDYWYAKVRIVQLTLEPTLKYNLSLYASCAFDTQCGPPILESFTFYSALWDDGTNSTVDNSTVTTTEDPSGTPQSAAPQRSTGASKGAIAGGVVGAVIGVLLVAALVFCLVRRKRKSSSGTKQKLEEHEQEHDVHVEPYIMPVDSSYTNEKNIRPPGVFQIDGVERREKAAHNGPFIDAWALESPRPLPTPPDVPRKGVPLGPEPSSSRSRTLPPSPADSPHVGDTRLSPSSSQPSPMVAPGPRQEEDMGLLEEVMSEQEGVIPPSYNPQWEEDARRRGKLRVGSTSAVPNGSSSAEL